MAPIVLVQPHAGRRISGGYRYNARMADQGAWELLSIGPERLAEALESVHARLVIADSIWLREDTVAPFLALPKRGIRLGFLMHSFPSMIAAAESGRELRSRPTRFELEVLERAGLVVAPGRHYADLLRGQRVEVAICEPGIDDAWRTPPRPRSGPCALISVGAVTARKGFCDVLEAMRGRSRKGDLRWTVVGSLDADPRYVERVREQASDFEGVALVGQKHPDEVRRMVVASDVFVMPSYDENQPLVLLEAMAASVPAVAYGAGAAALMLGHGTRGLVGPIGDRATLAQNLVRLIDDEAERYRMAVACWEAQRQFLNWSAAAAHARQLLAQT